MLKLKDEVPKSGRKQACEYARRFFGVLTRYYQHESRRKSALERIERRAKEDGLPGRLVLAMLNTASKAYCELLDSGRLDWEPSPEELIKRRGHAPRVLKAETRIETDEAKPVSEQNQAYGLIRAMVLMAVNAKLDEQKLDHYLVKRHYHAMVDRLLEIALAHGTGSSEWQAEVDATAPHLHDESFARATAALAAETFDLWKVKLPPRPADPT